MVCLLGNDKDFFNDYYDFIFFPIKVVVDVHFIEDMSCMLSLLFSSVATVSMWAECLCSSRKIVHDCRSIPGNWTRLIKSF